MKTMAGYPRWLSDEFFRGNLDPVCKAFRPPAKLYIGHRIFALSTTDDLRRIIGTFHGFLMEKGVTGAQVRVTNRPHWTDQRFELQLSWYLASDRGCRDAPCRFRFFIEWRDRVAVVRMMDVDAMPYRDEFLAHPAMAALELKGAQRA